LGRKPLVTMILLAVSCSPSPQPQDRGSKPANPPLVAVAAGGPPHDAAAMPKVAIARFEVPAGPLPVARAKLAFVVEATGPRPVTLPLDMLESAIFAFDLTDASGAPVRPIPPGVPPADYRPRTRELGPGEHARFEVELNVYSPPLAKGRYRARLSAITNIASDEVSFTIE
jgi:hypothetical protein